MPQLDFTFFISQIFWFLISFGVLYLSVYFFLIIRMRKKHQFQEKIIERSMLATKQLLESQLEIKENVNRHIESAMLFADELILNAKKNAALFLQESNKKVDSDAFTSLNSFLLNDNINSLLSELEEEKIDQIARQLIANVYSSNLNIAKEFPASLLDQQLER